MSKIILTGDRPTGRLHVGHYVGSLKRRVELQNSGEFDKIYIMIADAQALTDNADNPDKVRENIIEVALDYLACGLDPAKSTIFIQSMIPELTELTFYYSNLVTVSRLQRNPTVKNEIKMRDFNTSIPVGFFTYPISQAADITAFQANVVPVGEDQMPMLEQCKEIVHKFNTTYGEALTDPEILLPDNEACKRLPGIDGKAKMSKSLGNFILAKDFIQNNKANVVKLAMFKTHYRLPFNIKEELFKECSMLDDKIYNTLKQANLQIQIDGTLINQITQDENINKIMDEDFNTPNLITYLLELLKELNMALRSKGEIGSLYDKINLIINILGLHYDLKTLSADDKNIYQEWLEAKANKDYNKADELRENLVKKEIL